MTKKNNAVEGLSNKYAEKVKKWYDSGFWNKQMVRNAVIAEKITENDYFLITGEPYEE